MPQLDVLGKVVVREVTYFVSCQSRPRILSSVSSGIPVPTPIILPTDLPRVGRPIPAAIRAPPPPLRASRRPPREPPDGGRAVVSHTVIEYRNLPNSGGSSTAGSGSATARPKTVLTRKREGKDVIINQNRSTSL